MNLQKIIVGAPFGNYLNFPHTTSTLGTFTAKYRGGFWKRVWRVLKTVRYYPDIQAWKNKLGLPNPSVAWLSCQYPDKIISVMGFNSEEWLCCVKAAKACNPLAIELNISCPNCPGEDQTDYSLIFPKIVEVAEDVELIVKLPPVSYEKRAEAALCAGINSFHCCNTLPTPDGGMSGKPLKVFSLNCIKQMRTLSYTYKHLIGGGGVTCLGDAKEYLQAGCTNVSVASVLFNPLNWRRIGQMAKICSGHF